MNLLFYTHEFNLKEGRPCTKRVDSLAKYLSEQENVVTILTSSHNKLNDVQNSGRNYKIIYSYSTKNTKKNIFARLFTDFTFAVTSIFKAITKVGKIDAIVITSPPIIPSISGYIIGKIKKAKIIFDVRDIWPDVAIEMGSFSKNSIYYKVFNFIANFMYKHSDYITTVTPGKVKKLKKCAEPNKVKFISNGLDDEFISFKIDRNLVEKYQLEHKFTVIYTGNVGLAQNLDALLEIAEDYKENEQIQFIIWGDGAYKSTLQEKIKEKNLKNFKLEERIEYSKVRTILTYAKVSFISLKNNQMTDSVPTKIFDALGVGCPVLLLANRRCL